MTMEKRDLCKFVASGQPDRFIEVRHDRRIDGAPNEQRFCIWVRGATGVEGESFIALTPEQGRELGAALLDALAPAPAATAAT